MFSFRACQATLGLKGQDFCQQALSERDRSVEALTPYMPQVSRRTPVPAASPRPRATSATCPHGSRLLHSGSNRYHLLSAYYGPSTIPSALSVHLNDFLLTCCEYKSSTVVKDTGSRVKLPKFRIVAPSFTHCMNLILLFTSPCLDFFI